jgi:hypothetical protein
MKLTLAHISVALAIAASWAFLSGVAAHLVTYAPQVPAAAIAKAHRRGSLLVIFGIFGYVVSAALAGYSFQQSPISAIIALSICGVSLLFLLVLALRA